MPDIYPALSIQPANVVGNFLQGMQVSQDQTNQRVRNQLLQDEQAQRQAAMQRDQQFRNILAQSVGPMAANAAGGGGQPTAGEQNANYLMQGTQNPLGPSPDQLNQLIAIDPERAFQVQAQLQQQQQQRQAELQRRAGQSVRAAEFVLRSKDPKRTLEIGFPDMVAQLEQRGVKLEDLDDDAVRAMANDVLAQFGPIAGVGPAGDGEGFTLSQGQKRFNAQGQEIASVAPEEKDQDPNDKSFTREQSLRKEYADRRGAFDTIRSAYENVQSAEPNDSGDTQLVLNFMRTVSPGIRVQPGERIDDAASVPGVPSTAIALWNKVVGGGKLNDGQRAEIRSQAKRTYQTQKVLADRERAKYSNLGRMAGLDPYKIVGDEDAPVAEYDVSGRRSFDSVEDAEAAGLKPGTKVVIGGRAATIQ